MSQPFVRLSSQQTVNPYQVAEMTADGKLAIMSKHATHLAAERWIAAHYDATKLGLTS